MKLFYMRGETQTPILRPYAIVVLKKCRRIFAKHFHISDLKIDLESCGRMQFGMIPRNRCISWWSIDQENADIKSIVWGRSIRLLLEDLYGWARMKIVREWRLLGLSSSYRIRFAVERRFRDYDQAGSSFVCTMQCISPTAYVVYYVLASAFLSDLYVRFCVC